MSTDPAVGHSGLEKKVPRPENKMPGYSLLDERVRQIAAISFDDNNHINLLDK